MWSQRTAQIQKQFSPGPGKPPASTVPANVKAEDHGQAAVDDDEQEADDVGVVTDGLRSPSLDDAGTEKTQLRTESKFSAVEAREAELKQELEGVRKVSKTVEELIDSLEKTEGNMQTVSRTVGNASTLLNTWSRILSQTEHNQRLILDPNWHGASDDLSSLENETMARQQEAARRRELDELQAREAAARKAESEALDSRKAADTDSRYGRGKGRGPAAARGASATHGGTGGTTRAGHAGVARSGSIGGRGSRGFGRVAPRSRG